MRTLRWVDEAITDLEDIAVHLSERNPAASDRIQALIAQTTLQLPDHPFLYRQGRVPGTREAVVHPNYIVVYRVTDNEVIVAAVLHARQQYP